MHKLLPIFVLNLLTKYKKSSLLIIALLFSIQLISQTSVIDTSLARRIKEKEDLFLKYKDFIPGTAISKTTSGLPEQDCNGAISVCQYIYYTAISYSGVGNSDEIPGGSSCLFSNEKNSVWYTFSTSSSGNLAFNITPNTLTDDYDFALYDITGSNCSGISSGAILPVRCNYSAAGGVTGLSNSGGANQDLILATTPGKTYVLIISNYSSTQSGYTIDFSPGTASIFDNVSPTIQSVVAPCGSSSITVNTSEQVTCNSIAANGSDFTLSGPGGPYTVSSAMGINCGINSGQLTLSISPVLTGAGPWTLAIVSGSDGNTLMDGCGNPMATSSTTFALAPAVIAVTGNTAICSGGTTTLTASGVNTYTWSTGANTTTIVVTPTTTTIYTVSGTVSGLGCTAIGTKTVTVYTNSVSASPVTQTICQGSSASIFAAGAQSYTWSPGTSSSDPSFIAYPSTTTTYTLKGTNTCGTYSTLAVVNVTPISGTITITPSVAICAGNSATISVTGGTSYTWTPSTALSSTNTAVVVASPTSSTTYSVILKNASGCTRTYVQPVTVYTNNIGISPATQTICQGSSAFISSFGAQTYTWNTGSTLNSISVSPSVNTTYSLSGTNVCGTYTNSAIVYVTPISGTITSSPSFSICKGSSTTLTATGGTSYTWTPSTALSATNSAVVVASPTTSTVYYLTMTNASGCLRSYAKPITVYTNSISISSSTLSICQGATLTLTGTGAQTYTWSSGATSSSISISPTVNTTYSLTGTNPCGTYTRSISITVNPITGTITSSPSFSICKGGSTTLTASGGTSYTWSPSTALSSTNTAATVASPTISTTYSITLANAAGCSRTYTRTISVYTNSVILTPSALQICKGNSLTISATGAQTYTWSTGATTPTISVSPTVNTTYSVSGTNPCGTFTSAVTITVSVVSPTITSSPSFSICSGNTTTLTASGGNSYTWSPSASLSATNTAVVSASPSLSTTYTLTAANTLGCIKTYTQTVSVLAPPTVTVTGAPSFSICTGNTATLTALGGTSYTWSPGSSLSSTNTAIVSASPITSTTYSVIAANAIGCTKTFTQSIFVLAKPTLTINTASVTICSGDNALLNVTSNASSIVWTPSISVSPATGPTVTASPTSNTIYSISATGTNGCRTDGFINVSISSIVVTAAATPTSICDGQTAYLFANGGSSYTWSPASSLSSSSNPSVSATPTVSTWYLLSGSDAFGCSDTSLVFINVSPDYTLSTSVSQQTICLGANSILSATGGVSYTWSPAGSLSSAIGASVSANPTSSIVYTVTSINGNGCVKTQTQSVDVSDFTINVSNASSQSCIDSPISLLAVANPIGTYSYSWAPNSLLSATNIPNPQIISSVAIDNTYSVSIINSFGCVKSSSIYVQIIDCSGTGTITTYGGIKIYSGVSPNGDNHNDTWIIDGIEGEPNNSIIILNKWGQEVWKTDGYNNLDKVWKGNNQSGEALTDGTYYYILTTSTDTYKGRVELIR